MKRSAISLMAVCLCSAVLAKTGDLNYHLEKAVKLGGDGGWDYLYADGADHRVYISRGTHVTVVDTRSDSVIGDIPDTPGVHGVAIARKHGVGFSSNGRDSTVSEFDLKTLKVLKKIKVGDGPDAIIYDPSSDRVFTFNAGSSDTTAVDAATGAVAGTIQLDGKPEFPATDGHGKMFVNIEDKSEITQFDPAALKTVNTWPIAPGEEASGLAIDTKDHVLFAVCSNQKMVVFDYDAGKVIATPAIGNGPDAAGYDPKMGYAFSSNGEGNLTVVGKDASGNWVPLQTVQTKASARTMTVDTTSHKIYLVSAEFGPAPEGGTGRRRRGPMVPGSFSLLVVSP
jgi:DNA-binding beta-propeller fold protein YncE